MLPIIAFSGLESSVWALASAVAIAATFSLQRCMGGLHVSEIKADGTRLRALRPDAVADRLLGILRNQRLQFALGPLVVGMGLSGLAEQSGVFGPGIGGGHVDHPHRLDPGLWWFAIEQGRRLAGFDR